MSGGLAPSKSTVYVSNLPFSLTNNDLYRIFSKYGKVVKVTIMKDKDTRKSKGVAFILFLDKDSAQNCTRAINNKQLFGRVIKASIAIDNGRAAEFIRRRNYFDKSKCYECGESGHLSYACPKNMLGEREPPKKKEKKKKKKIPEPEEEIEEVEESEDEGEDPALDSLSQAIAFQVTFPYYWHGEFQHLSVNEKMRKEGDKEVSFDWLWVLMFVSFSQRREFWFSSLGLCIRV
ncbi:zinc finger CCHC-type and RNA-binding motif-containing protein 1 isoform 2-T2 [Callospermophilus lateralis]|uniref:zinc finger CCHC-type and RNA-binding motif-containing protein 1 isoform X2 n=1 Tax=Callospermophilus lateralis TaxID=76772 RepID=UPI004038DEA5